MKKIGGVLLATFVTSAVFFGITQPTYAADAIINGTTKKASDNSAIESMYVYAENTATGVASYGLSNATGTYSIVIDDTGSGTAGTYTVYNYYFAHTDYDTYYVRQTQTVSLSNGETKNGMHFLLDKQGKYAGHVYAKDGVTPIYNANISSNTTINGLGFYGSDFSTAAGFYQVTPISSSNFSQANDGIHNIYATAIGYFGSSQAVATTKNNLATANFSLTRGSTVSGKVTTLEGAAISGVTVQLAEVGTTRMYNAVTDSAGNYTVSVYDMADYGGTAVGYYNLSILATNYVAQSASIRITADESSSVNNNFALIAAGSITGIIYQSDGTTALGSATITADDGYGNTTSVTSASNGTYTLNSLRASDHYTVTVAKDGYVTAKAYMVSVTAGNVTSSENFSLQTAVHFSGTITNKDTTAAVEGATVYLYNLAKPRYTSYTADYTVTTRTDGSFVAPNIVPGKYRIKIVKVGYLTIKDRKMNLRSSVEDKNYVMTPASGVFGKITDKKNQFTMH